MLSTDQNVQLDLPQTLKPLRILRCIEADGLLALGN